MCSAVKVSFLVWLGIVSIGSEFILAGCYWRGGPTIGFISDNPDLDVANAVYVALENIAACDRADA